MAAAGARPATTPTTTTTGSIHPDYDHSSTIFNKNRLTIVTCLFAICTCTKILLIPSYRSTDFNVHRHWKAVTLHLPLTDWYFDDMHVETVHTFDYPPGFAWFEYAWSNNPITTFLLRHEWLDARCLALLPDTDTEQPSTECIAFMRCTVIVSDMIFWLGSAAISLAAVTTTKRQAALFLLLTCHPALLWLDHVHFQYNGMLMGLLLLSLSCLLRGNHTTNVSNASTSFQFHVYHLTAAATFSLLLTCKHLYLILAPWYFTYLLKRYVLVVVDQTSSSSSSVKSVLARLLALGTVTLTTLLLPVLPFLWATNDIRALTVQIGQRLFPFDRGLVHDYWAGNVWALHQGFNKVAGVMKQPLLPALPDVSPRQCALILLLSLLPGCWHAYKAAEQKCNQRLVLSITYSALASFLTAFHVHEKAIVTTLLPFTVWAVGLAGDNNNNNNSTDALDLLLQTTAAAVLGLCPLLYRPVEMWLKICTLVPYLAVLGYYYQQQQQRHYASRSFQWWHKIAWTVPVWALVEVVPVRLFGRYEFVPLAVTSISVAVVLLACFARITHCMVTLPASGSNNIASPP